MDPAMFPTLDPELAPVLELLPDLTQAMEDIEASRAMLAALIPNGPVPGEELLDISDVEHEGVRLRVYRPRTTTGNGVLYLHGGGFCLGDVNSEHGGAVQIANACDAVVVSVDYRLAPEHPYPAGLEYCYAGLVYLSGLVERIAVHGQSAGGGLAAATALLARDRKGPRIAFQSLGMPELDDRLETPSMQAFVGTPPWSRPQAIKSWEYYLGGKAADGYAAPARAEDLSGLPPAHVTVMELDPLRDEGIAYASRLLQAGVSVELHAYPGTFHGSSLAVDAGVSRRMAEDMLGALRRALH
ncbi:MAG: alpha/beta hydrolase [Mycobacteriales bacterium]